MLFWNGIDQRTFKQWIFYCWHNLKCPDISNLKTLAKWCIENCITSRMPCSYGQVSYIRMINIQGKIHCLFLIGKAQVTPMKFITVPRLELVAATTSIRIGNMVKKELDNPIDRELYRTDSTTVLRCFLANRTQMMQWQWHHIEGCLNPADNALRGLCLEQLLNCP